MKKVVSLLNSDRVWEENVFISKINSYISCMMECFVLPMHVHWYRPDIRISNCHKSPIYYRHIAASRHNDSPYWKRLPPSRNQRSASISRTTSGASGVGMPPAVQPVQVLLSVCLPGNVFHVHESRQADVRSMTNKRGGRARSCRR